MYAWWISNRSVESNSDKRGDWKSLGSSRTPRRGRDKRTSRYFTYSPTLAYIDNPFVFIYSCSIRKDNDNAELGDTRPMKTGHCRLGLNLSERWTKEEPLSLYPLSSFMRYFIRPFSHIQEKNKILLVSIKIFARCYYVGLQVANLRPRNFFDVVIYITTYIHLFRAISENLYRYSRFNTSEPTKFTFSEKLNLNNVMQLIVKF